MTPLLERVVVEFVYSSAMQLSRLESPFGQQRARETDERQESNAFFTSRKQGERLVDNFLEVWMMLLKIHRLCEIPSTLRNAF